MTISNLNEVVRKALGGTYDSQEPEEPETPRGEQWLEDELEARREKEDETPVEILKARAPYEERLHPRNPHTGEWIDKTGFSEEILQGLQMSTGDLGLFPGTAPGPFTGHPYDTSATNFPGHFKPGTEEVGRPLNGEEAEAVHRGLTPVEARAGNDYTSNLSREINTTARGKDPFPQESKTVLFPQMRAQRTEAKAAIPVLDKLIAEKGVYPRDKMEQRVNGPGGIYTIPLEEARTEPLYRGVHMDRMTQEDQDRLLTPGAVFEDRGFLSATYTRATARQFGDTIIELTIPDDQKALYVPDYFSGPLNQAEGEFVFARKQKIRVDSVDDPRGVTPLFNYLGTNYRVPGLVQRLLSRFPKTVGDKDWFGFTSLDDIKTKDDAELLLARIIKRFPDAFLPEDEPSYSGNAFIRSERTVHATLLSPGSTVNGKVIALPSYEGVLKMRWSKAPVIERLRKSGTPWDERLHPRNPHTGEWVKIFAHGVLMDEHTMQHLAPGAQKVGDAVLPDHRHLPWGRNVPSTVVPERGSTTRGVLWNVPKSQMPELDALEGVSTNWYERVPVTVKVGRKPHKAEVYREPLPDSKARVVGTGKFSKAFRKARAENPHIRDFTTDFSAKELDQMTLFLTPDGKTGGGLRDLGNGKTEVVGLFNNGGEPGSGTKLLELLISHGGNVLNCFDEFLRKLYEKQGFEVVEQFEWDDQQKPSTWDVNKRGRPPVYLMEIPRWHRLRN